LIQGTGVRSDWNALRMDMAHILGPNSAGGCCCRGAWKTLRKVSVGP